MSKGILRASLQTEEPSLPAPRLSWEERRLPFVVREPFLSKWSGTDLVTGFIEENSILRIESHMPEKGVIFSDGMEEDFLEFTSGSIASVGLADKRTFLLDFPSKSQKNSSK